MYDVFEADGHIYLQNEDLSWTGNFKYLGSNLSKDLSEAKEIAMKPGDLIGRVNNLLSNFGTASDAPSAVICMVHSRGTWRTKVYKHYST